MRLWSLDSGRATVSNVRQLPQELGRHERIWLDLDLDTEQSVLEHELLGLAAVTRESLAQDKSRAKTIVHEHYVYAVYVVPTGGWNHLQPRAFHIVVGSFGVVTAHTGDVDPFFSVKRAEEAFRTGEGALLYALLDPIVKIYEDLNEQIIDRTEHINQRLVLGHLDRLSSSIHEVRRQALQLRRMLLPSHEALHLLASQSEHFLPDDGRPYFLDLKDRVDQVLDDVAMVRDSMSSTVESLASVQSNNINQVMKVLTILSILFLPATLVASVYGMNFNIPEYHWSFGYWYALGLMVSITAAIFIYIRRHNWFQRGP